MGLALSTTSKGPWKNSQQLTVGESICSISSMLQIEKMYAEPKAGPLPIT